MKVPSTCYVATSNPGKLDEFKTLFSEFFPEIKEVIAHDSPNVVEDKDTFVENSLIKAKTCLKELEDKKITEFCILADDSGLTVESLRGAPGVHSARYAGTPSNSEKNIQKLLEEMKSFTHPEERRAQFQCALAFIVVSQKNDRYHMTTVQGSCEGTIAFEKRGQAGFGYDPVFIDLQSGKTFAELSDSEKNKRSHRYQAFVKLKKLIEDL